MGTTFAVNDVDVGEHESRELHMVESMCRRVFTNDGRVHAPPELSDILFDGGFEDERLQSAWSLWTQAMQAHHATHERWESCWAHGLIETILTAFDNHFPLILSPDHIWTTLVQGFAAHIRQDAEAFRGRFVSHEGKKKLVVRRDDFVMDAPDNDWGGVVTELSEQIRQNVGDARYRLLVPEFSTTGIIERTVAQIGLMDAVSDYFDYHVMTLCGIPSITLEGTPEDWESVRERAQVFREFELDWWLDALLPILDQLVSASRGDVDATFWRNIIKKDSMSGGPYLSGWVVSLIPYILTYEDVGSARVFVRNPHLGTLGARLSMSDLPTSISRVEAQWSYLGEPVSIVFHAGTWGMHYDPETKALTPVLGWMVRRVEDFSSL